MSAIGDYVHLYAVHYEQTGINRLNEGVGPAYSYAAEKARITQRMASHPGQMSEGEKQILREELAYIFSTQNAQDDPDVAAYQQMLYNKLQALYEQKLGSINWDTANVTAAGVKSMEGKVLGDLRVGKKEMHLQTIKNRWNIILENRDKIESQMNKNELNGIINNINNFIKSIEEETRAGVKELSGGDYTFPVRTQSGTVYKKVDSVVSDVNSLIRMLGMTPPINLEKGDLFEYAIALAQAAALGKTYESTEEAMEQVVGKNRSNVQLNLNYLSKDFDIDATDIYYSDAGGCVVNLGFTPTQEKVDVRLELGDGRIANVSAKNVNLASGRYVHILSSSSLLYLLQGADSNFVNHYLNMVASHPDGNSWNIAKNVMSAREGVKMTVLWEALSGDTFGRENSVADTFIVNNDVASGVNSVQIYDIADLAEKAMTNIDAFTNITANGGDIDSITFNNSREESSYTARLSKLIEDVHAQKISVALSPILLT